MIRKKKLTSADVSLILANLLPVVGVWFFDWDPFLIFLVYCLETIIIGLMTLVKLGIAGYLLDNENKKSTTHRILGIAGFMLFFILHYGIFVGVQTSMFLGFTDTMKGLNILQILADPSQYLGATGMVMLAVFTLSYAFETITGYLWYDENKKKSMVRIMMEPYIRIFIQQFTVILGAFFLMFGAGKIFILVFACIKIWITIFIDYEKTINTKLAQAKAQESNNSHS